MLHSKRCATSGNITASFIRLLVTWRVVAKDIGNVLASWTTSSTIWIQMRSSAICARFGVRPEVHCVYTSAIMKQWTSYINVTCVRRRTEKHRRWSIISWVNIPRTRTKRFSVTYARRGKWFLFIALLFASNSLFDNLGEKIWIFYPELSSPHMWRRQFVT